MKKRILLIALLWNISAIGSGQCNSTLNSYQELLDSLLQGNRVKVVMKFGQCSLVATNPEPKQKSDAWMQLIGGMEITNFNKHAVLDEGRSRDAIASSTSMLIEHATMGNVLNYVRLRFFEDNSVEVYSSFVDPKLYGTLQSMKFKCQMSNAKEQNGVSVFKL